MTAAAADKKTSLRLDDLEFQASHCKATFMPNFSTTTTAATTKTAPRINLELLSHTIGPFVAAQPIELPLWVALELRRCKRGRLIAPHWLNREFWAQTLADERRLESKLSEMPHDSYYELSNILFKE
ncbi:MAG: DNA replication complex GINS protein PSF2 [Marteilia pararefringens]